MFQMPESRALGMFGTRENRGATFSPCSAYRYRLWRIWDQHLPLCAFVMLNPSTADAEQDDPTIRRCLGFARRWGYGGLFVVNLFAFRATKPIDLRAAVQPIGQENDQHLHGTAKTCARIVVAWGTSCRWRGMPSRDRVVLVTLRGPRPNSEPIMCLGKTARGFPKHPIYVKGGTKPTPYGEAP